MALDADLQLWVDEAVGAYQVVTEARLPVVDVRHDAKVPNAILAALQRRQML